MTSQYAEELERKSHPIMFEAGGNEGGTKHKRSRGMCEISARPKIQKSRHHLLECQMRDSLCASCCSAAVEVKSVGRGVGARVGPGVGKRVGLSVGSSVGNQVGLTVGLGVGDGVGSGVGVRVGDCVGAGVWGTTGASEGATGDAAARRRIPRIEKNDSFTHCKRNATHTTLTRVLRRNTIHENHKQRQHQGCP